MNEVWLWKGKIIDLCVVRPLFPYGYFGKKSVHYTRSFMVHSSIVPRPTHTALGCRWNNLHRSTSVDDAACLHVRVMELQCTVLQLLLIHCIRWTDHNWRLVQSQCMRSILTPFCWTCNLHKQIHLHCDVSASKVERWNRQTEWSIIIKNFC